MNGSNNISKGGGSLNTEENALNIEKQNKKFTNNTAAIHKILASFKTSFDDFETEFRKAEQKGDTETMSRLASSLKNSAGDIQAEFSVDQTEKLQQKTSDGEGLGDSFDDLLSRLDDLNEQINGIK